MVVGGSSLHHNYLYRWLPCQLFFTPDDGRMMPETCRESLQ